MKKISFLLVLIALLFSNLLTQSKFNIIFINNHKFVVELALTEKEHELGLMFRKSIPENYGMLFVFKDIDVKYFWMKNTLIALDIIYIDSNGVIQKIYHNVKPCKREPCKLYSSEVEIKYVLELNGNTCKKMKIKEGDKVVGLNPFSNM